MKTVAIVLTALALASCSSPEANKLLMKGLQYGVERWIVPVVDVGK